MPGKRVQFDDENMARLNLLAHDSMKTFQELAAEAFADLLKKHGRPADLKSALRQSLQESEKPSAAPRVRAPARTSMIAQ